MELYLMKQGCGRVTARGIYFKGKRFTCSRAIREQWFEKAAFNREWRIKIYYRLESDSIVYIADDLGGLEACNQIDISNSISDIKLQQYFESIQNLQELRKRLNKYRVYRSRKKWRGQHGRINGGS